MKEGSGMENVAADEPQGGGGRGGVIKCLSAIIMLTNI